MLQSVAITPGVGKTHIAVGLARKAAEAGYRTYFTTAADLVARCHRAALEGRWATTMRFYAGPTLLVIDLCRARDYAEVQAVPLWWAGSCGLRLGIVTGSRGRPAPYPAVGSGRVSPLPGW